LIWRTLANEKKPAVAGFFTVVPFGGARRGLGYSGTGLQEIAMYLVGLGLVFLTLKFMEIGPIAMWDWWIVLSPFGLAIAWWAWADTTGYTKRKAMEREDARRLDRIERNRDAMGMLRSKKKGR
jgi:small Trp-rich protein